MDAVGGLVRGEIEIEIANRTRSEPVSLTHPTPGEYPNGLDLPPGILVHPDPDWNLSLLASVSRERVLLGLAAGHG